MAETELQLNETENGFAIIPYPLFKKKVHPKNGRFLRKAEILILGTIFGFSSAKENASCNKTYRTFEENLNLSHGTVARAIKELKEAELIIQDKSRRICSSYRFNNPKKSKKFIVIDFFLYATKFTVRGETEPRYLTKSEIEVLSLIRTHCSNKHGKGFFESSVRGIASILNLCDTTVQKCITTLLHADLIFRPENEKGINNYQRSRFTVNKKLLRKSEKKFQKQASPTAPLPSKEVRAKEQEIENANARAERERYYMRLQNIANSRAKAFQERLEADDTYKRVDTDRRKLEPQIGRAEAFCLPELTELYEKRRKLLAERARRMAELNISEADLQPIWHCPKCSDTGFRPNGRMCDCYPGGRQQP